MLINNFACRDVPNAHKTISIGVELRLSKAFIPVYFDRRF